MKRKWIFLAGLISLSVSVNTWAMPQEPKQLRDPARLQLRDFFKTPSSMFRSGQASLSELASKRTGARNLELARVEIGKYQEWIPATNLYTLKDFSFKEMNLMSAYAKANAIIYRKQDGKWIPFARIPRGSLFKVEKMLGAWACGNYRNDYICLGNDQITLAIDFAKKVTIKNGKSIKVVERKEDQLLTQNNIKIPWKQITDWTPQADLAIVKAQSQLQSQSNLTPFEKVLVREHKTQQWIESEYSGHGRVWWLLEQQASEQSPLLISTKDIRERGIFDWSTNKNSLAIASANGIFLSHEKDVWQFLPQFGEANFPVAVGLHKILLVGDQVSRDQGQNFEPYVRWDLLSAQIQNILDHPPKYIKIARINIPEGLAKQNTVQLDIETGYRNLSFTINLVTQSVNLVK